MYVTSLSGIGSHWQAKGVQSIYSESADHYRVYLKYPDSNTIKGTATSSRWHMNTLSLDRNQVPPGLCTGTEENTAWGSYNGHVVIDVDTRGCKFTSTPKYFTSISGNGNHWATMGGSSIYSETADGFRVYVHRENGATPQYAQQMNWRLNWVAVE
jgi:hypothetical protein